MHPIPDLFFVFDVESIGLHGDAFAVAGGVYHKNGATHWEFSFACPLAECYGLKSDREWVLKNVPLLDETHRAQLAMREDFWLQWKRAKADGAVMAADCAWPVEGRFLARCVSDRLEERNFEGPYPLHEIASFLQAAGLDPMATYERTPSEMPKHNPLCDARQSARMLARAIAILEKSVES